MPLWSIWPMMTGVDAEKPITLWVNGQARTLLVEPRVTLVDALRDSLSLTGTKKGGDRGECGACTVHVNGRRVLACLTLAVMVEGSEVTTIEGIAEGAQLYPVQVRWRRAPQVPPPDRAPRFALTLLAGWWSRDGHPGDRHRPACVMTSVVVDVLGVPADSVEVRLGDTSLPAAGMTAGSSATMSVGSVVHAAATRLRDKLAALDPSAVDSSPAEVLPRPE